MEVVAVAMESASSKYYVLLWVGVVLQYLSDASS